MEIQVRSQSHCQTVPTGYSHALGGRINFCSPRGGPKSAV